MALGSRQILLPLESRSGWGGARSGAGRNLDRHDAIRTVGERRSYGGIRVTSRSRWKDVPRSGVCGWWRSSSAAGARRASRGDFVSFTIPSKNDHVHMIVEASSARDLASGLKSITARFGRGVNRVFRRAGRVLTDRSHVHVLRTPREVRNAIAYVLLNARRHLAKRGRVPVRVARFDPASSARWFSGWRNGAPPSRDPPAVAAPRTWLLSIGWRRWGLIDTAEIPGAK